MVGHLEPSIAHIIGAEIGQCYVSATGKPSIQNPDFEFNIYPNPSSVVFSIRFTSKQLQDLQIRITNVVGVLVCIENMEQFIGEYTKQI